MVSGMTYSLSTQKKINTIISTEANHESVNNMMPQVVWNSYFLEGRGYNMRDKHLYQNNHSLIILKEKGKISGSKQTSHINITYFFVTGIISEKYLKVHYCHTLDIIAFFNKTTVGNTFPDIL